MSFPQEVKTLFHDKEAEKALISIAFSDFDYFNQLEALGVEPGWFCGQEAQFMWVAMRDQYHAAQECHGYGINSKIAETITDVERGAYRDYFTNAARASIPPSHLETYFNRALVAFQRREAYRAAQRWLTLLHDGAATVEDSFTTLENEISAIRRYATPFEIYNAAELESDFKEAQVPESMPFEINSVQAATEGIRRGEITLLRAKTGVGKTALLQREAYYQAVYQGKVVLYVSLEMARHKWMGRVHQQETGIPSIRLEQGKYDQWKDAIYEKLAQFGKSKLYMIDDPWTTTDVIRRACEHIHRVEGQLDIVVVDYAQLLKDKAQDDLERQVKVSQVLTAMPKEFNCHVFAIARENRQGQIHGSSQYEYDADNLWLLENELARERIDPKDKSGPAVLVIEKQRYGQSGLEVELYYNSSFVRFTDKNNDLGKVDLWHSR